MNRLKISILLLFVSVASYGQVYINEFMASNTSTILDPDYKQSADWIELYNSGTSPVILDGYFLTDNLKKPQKWKINKMTIAAKGFALFWADDKDSANHTSFALSASGEQVGLANPSGALIDSVRYGVQTTDLSNYGAGSISVLDSTLLGVPDPNISMGRKPDGSSDWVLFTQPTPGTSNITTGYSDIVKSDPGFSSSGGVYHGSVSLTIKSIFGGDVRYTLDGTEPNEQSFLADGPIIIDKNTVVRARIHKAGQILGPITTNTYLIDTGNKINKLPIVCVTSDPLNFWDPVKGIYAVHTVKPDWEIPINIELYENDGRTGAAFDLRGGAKSTGLYSWQLPEKMLGINFRKEYGTAKIDYPLIFDKPRKVYKTFSLRASGSDWGNTMFRDGMIQTAAVYNTSLDNMGFRASVVYINGQYMGVHNIREKIDEDYIVGNHGLAAGTFDMIEETDAGHYAETGDFKANDFFLSLTAKDLSNQANYDAVAAQMDINEFTEMVSTEVYSGNNSIGHNLMKWKAKDSGKWKWILMDFDRGFFGANNQMISFYLNEDGWPFRDLMKNTDYKKLFGRKLSDLLFTTFNPTRMIAQIDDHQTTIEAEMPNHIARWAGTRGTGNYSSIYAISSMDYWYSEVEKLRTFAQARPGIILNDLTNYGFQAPVAVSVTTFPVQAGVLTFNGLKIPVDVCAGGYPKGESIKLSAEAKDGYKFMGWKTNSDTLFIPRQSTWKYSDTGVDLGISWRNADFTDTGWKSGPAELGYGDGDEKTVIGFGSDANNKYISSYFRTSFVVKNKQKVSGLTLLLKCDDGAVIYLNDTEIQRYNMPAGTISFGTLASTAIAGADESAFNTFTIGAESLAEGNNTIAVEVHQSAANSSDVSFDLELSASLNGSGGYQSTANELVVSTQSAVNITAVFESEGKCILPAEITTVMTLHKSCSPYLVPENVNITSAGKLIIEPGVELWISDGVSISSLGPVKAIGTKAEPVIFRSNPQSVNQKWGNFSIKNASDTVWFKHVIIENASEGPNPVRDIAAIAVSGSTVIIDSITIVNNHKNPINVYNCQTTVTNSRIHSDYAGCDEINIKRGKILISNCEFIGNPGVDCDALDFGEMSEGSATVRNSYFHDMDGFNSDAVDLGDHAKNVIIDGIVVYNFQDKGVSIGQQSSAKITNSVFINCGMGAGMKDSSSVYIDHCSYYGNFYALANYQKHPGDAGSNLVVTNTILSNSYELGYFSDEFSSLSISNSSDDTELLPAGKNNLNVNPLFMNAAIYDFSLLSGSPLIGAATNGTIGANLKLPALPLSVMISDIAYVTDPTAEDLEFIGLYNPADMPIHLDSCQFASGVAYLFPTGTVIGAKEKIFITSNASSVFWSSKNLVPYQWESGHLADEGEKIQLVNKYGKVIDQVIYNNKAPWPVPQNAQQGITLTRYDVDNHFGEYWKVIPVNDMTGVPAISNAPKFTVYPNPASDQLRISLSGESNVSGEIYSSIGQLVKQIRLDFNGDAIVDVSSLKNGIYLVRVGKLTTKVTVSK